MQKPKFHDRWDDSDVIGKTGEPVVLKDGDIIGVRQEILDVLAEYRVLDVSYIAAVLGRDIYHVYECIKILRSRSNRYIQLAGFQRDRNLSFLINATLFWELAPRGVKLARERGKTLYRGEFYSYPHKIMEEYIMAEFDIAAKHHPEIQLLKRDNVLSHDRWENLEHPEWSWLDKERDEDIRFDGRTFALQRPDVFQYFFPGIEAETGSHSGPAVGKKFRNNIRFFELGLHKTRYRAANSLRIPYYPHAPNSLKDMLERWKAETEGCPTWRKRLWFKVHPRYDADPKPRPTAHMFEEPFWYVDTDGSFKELNLLQLERRV